MAVDDSQEEAFGVKGPLEPFDADQTVRSWVRLATQAREGNENLVRLQLSVDLNAIAKTQLVDREKLISSLVTLVASAKVEATLVMICVKPGTGVATPVLPPPGAPGGTPIKPLTKPKPAKPSKQGKMPKAPKRTGRK